MPPIVAVLDANALYPATLRDTLLLTAEDGLFQPRWTDAILIELRRSLIRNRAVWEEQADHLLGEMRAAFEDADVPGYRLLLAAMTNHPKDRHVAAAGVASHPQVIVTSNLSDFPSASLAPFGIEAQSPDAFLTHLLSAYPERMVAVVERQAALRKRPPADVGQVLDALGRTAPGFAQLVRAYRSPAG